VSYLYRAYGLCLQLPFACALLEPATAGAPPDVTLAYGQVPRELQGAVARNDDGSLGPRWQSAPNRFLALGGRRAGRFLVEGGSRITLERNPAAEDERIAHLLLHIALAAVLRQRGLLVLHANAAVTPAGAVAVSGASGSGKSTTLAALLNRGCRMLSDDITALRMDGRGIIEVLPGAPQMYLWEEAAASLGHDVRGLARNPLRRAKVIVPSAIGPAAMALRALYLIGPDAGDELQSRLLSGAEKFAALQDCVYGPMLREEHTGQFGIFAALAGQVPVYQVRRPAGRWTVNEVAGAILDG
jgi:hypothetical protein